MQAFSQSNAYFYSEEWNGFFNWTMTYRQDSDFYTPYGKISLKGVTVLPENIEDYARKFGESQKKKSYLSTKKKALAWFVSNCDTPSNRMEYVRGKYTKLQDTGCAIDNIVQITDALQKRN